MVSTRRDAPKKRSRTARAANDVFAGGAAASSMRSGRTSSRSRAARRATVATASRAGRAACRPNPAPMPCRRSGSRGRRNWRRNRRRACRRSPAAARPARRGRRASRSMRSASDSASSWSCVMRSDAIACSRWMRRISSRMVVRVAASSADSGSSSSSACGSKTSARPSATRCCWPPDSCAGRRSRESAETDLIEHGQRTLSPLGHRNAAHAQRIRDVLPDAHVRKERIALEHDAALARAYRQRADVVALEADRAGIRRQEAGDDAQERRLAAARGTDADDELARGNRQRNVLHAGCAAGIPEADAVERDRRAGVRPSRVSGWRHRCRCAHAAAAFMRPAPPDTRPPAIAAASASSSSTTVAAHANPVAP